MDFENFRNILVSPALRAIVDHWHDARGSAPMPSWDQLRPARMAPHLSIIWAYKYDASEDKFVGRLAGDGITRGLLQKSFRGVALDELWLDPVQVHQKMLRVISEPKIYRKAGILFRDGERLIEGERIALPLADGVLGASAYDHPLRSDKPGNVELFDRDEEWFSVTGRPASAGTGLQPEP